MSSESHHNPHNTPALPNFTRYITTHDANGTAIVHSSTESVFREYDSGSFRFNVPFTTSEFPAELSGDADVAAHESLIASGNLGLVSPNGTVCRVVDFAPMKSGSKGLMHRTQSLDFGIVLEGSIEMWLDSGEMKLLKKGDIAVQRGTMHEWRNPSETEWTRMVFVLQGTKPLVVGEKVLKEELGTQTEIKPSATASNL
ncbi:Cupin domain protein [Aspergillus bombycis]|uniref:Cupin domain protein n=1 Tax=Aspergillus bombycis TaxID=109264 RepID=A0A1F7ZTF8_9EURO|nr:Cupin domain protein [Aspergillus bombycis]OGM42732.1 Cupin domain protein [Aspergillus bombycis]